MVVHRTCRHPTRPTGDEGDADAALVALALQATELPVAAEEGRVGTAFLVRAVVAGEDDQRVLVQPLLPQLGQHLAHVCVQTRDHRRELGVGMLRGVVAGAFLAAPRVVAEETTLVALQQGVLGLHQLGVRKRVGEDAEERTTAVLTVEPLQRLPVNQVGGVLRTLAVITAEHRVTDVLVHHHTDSGRIPQRTAVAVQEVGVVQVRLELADVAVELVDAPLLGCRDRTFVAARPLAEHAGGVALVLQNLGQDDMAGVIRMLAHDTVVTVLAVHHDGSVPPVLLVAPHLAMAGMLAGHEAGTRRGADRTAGVGLREPHPFLRHTVDVGRMDIGLSVTAQVAITHVVAHDINNVRLPLLGGSAGHRKHPASGQHP